MARGGKREGAGRPAPDGKKIYLGTRISPNEYERLKAIAETEGGFGKAIEKLINERGSSM